MGGVVWGSSPAPGRVGPSGQKRPPAALPPLPVHSNPRVGGRGQESPFPPPLLQPWQFSITAAVQGPGTHGPTSQQGSRSHTYTHTHTPTPRQTKGLDTPVPSRPQARRSGGIPLRAPLQGKLGLRLRPGGGPGPLGGRGSGRGREFHRSPRRAGPRLAGWGLRKGWPQAEGVYREDPSRDSQGRLRGGKGGGGDVSTQLPGDRSCPAPTNQGPRSPSSQNWGQGRRKLPHQRQAFANLLPTQHLHSWGLRQRPWLLPFVPRPPNHPPPSAHLQLDVWQLLGVGVGVLQNLLTLGSQASSAASHSHTLLSCGCGTGQTGFAFLSLNFLICKVGDDSPRIGRSCFPVYISPSFIFKLIPHHIFPQKLPLPVCQGPVAGWSDYSNQREAGSRLG